MRNLAHTIETPAVIFWFATSLLVVALAPMLLFAANDAILQSSDARITTTSNGTNITVRVSGAHTVDSITVDSGSFDVVLSQSSLVITSPDRYKLNTSPETFSTFVCGSSESTLTLQRSLEGTATVTVTPSTTTCGGGGGGSPGGSGSSGGSGGGSAADAFTSTAVVAVAPAAVVAAPAIAGAASDTELSGLINLFIALGIIPESKADAARAALSSQKSAPVTVSAKFTKGIGFNSKGADVKRLQQLLNTDADTRVAASGVGSSGSETETFGPATEKALQKFQVKYGIAGPGSEGYGFMGPKTRAKLEEVFGSTAVPAATVATPSPVAAAVSPVFNSTLSRGAENADVKRLQQLLNSDPDTRIASSGVGSPGNETNFFGTATENAVKKFQAKYGIVSSGDPTSTGYGMVGAKTRAKLQEVFGK